MRDSVQAMNEHFSIEKHIRCKSGRNNFNNSEVIKKSDIYHNSKSIYQSSSIHSHTPDHNNKFSLDLSKIKSKYPQKMGIQDKIDQNNSYLAYQQELEHQYQQAVYDQIKSERSKKQKQLYIPNLNQYLEDFKKRKYQSPSVSQKIVAKNPYQNVHIPQEYIEKLAGDMMNNFREGKTCPKYDNIMDFIKGKPFYLKLGEMNYRQSEKNKVDIQDQPSSLQYQHIRARKLQLGERPLSREKRREQDEHNWIEQDSARSIQINQQKNQIQVRPYSIQQRRDTVNKKISKRDQSLDISTQHHDKEKLMADNKQLNTPKIQNHMWRGSSFSSNQDRTKMNNFLSKQVTPNSKQAANHELKKKFKKDLSISRSTLEARADNDFTIDQASTKYDDQKSPNSKPMRSRQVTPRDQYQESYNTFLTQDLVSQNFVNSNQKMNPIKKMNVNQNINNHKKDQEIIILLQGDHDSRNDKQGIKMSSVFKQNSLEGDDTFHSSSARNNFSFEKQTYQKLNSKLDDQLWQRSQEQGKRRSLTHRIRPESEMKIIDDRPSQVGSSYLQNRINFLSVNKPRSVANKKHRNNEDSVDSLACGSIINDCKDILRGSSIDQIGEADYFNDKYFEKNYYQNERKHKIRKDIVTMWQKQKEMNQERKENLLSEIAEQVALVKQFKEEQPLIKTELQKSGAIIDRYFRSQDVVKPFFQKKMQSKSIV